MVDTAEVEERELARLREEFRGHRIWRSTRWTDTPGDWCATLRDRAAGVDPTVIRSTSVELREALHLEKIRADSGELPV